MLETINHNQGAIMVLLTFFVVLSSILSWIWSRKQLNQMITQWKKAEEPYIIAGIEGIDTIVYLSIINTGNEPAINVKFKFEDRFIEDLNEPEEKKNMLRDFGKIGLSLIPQKTIYVPTFYRYTDIADKNLNLTITYSNIQDEVYSKDISFDLKMYGAILEQNHFESKKFNYIMDNRNSLKNLSDSFKEIVAFIKSKK